MSEVRKKLEKELSNYFIDTNYILGIVCNCKTEKGWQELYDFIMLSKRLNDTLTTENISAMSLIIGEKIKNENVK